MRLYHNEAAPNPRRVRMFLAEKGLSVPLVAVDIATRENLGEAYRAKNPLGVLPALELEDGTVLCESMAICRYFEALHPEPNLFGATPLEQAQVEQWSRHAELELLFPIAHAFRNMNPFWEGRLTQVRESGEVAQALARERLAWFDAQLGQRRFLAGDRFTVADITLFCAVAFGRVAQVRPGAEHPHLAAWFETIKARPSAKA